MFETLEALVREGKVRCYGVAVSADAERLDEGEAAVRERRMTVVQVAHSILWQEHARAFAPAGQPDAPALLCRAPHASGLLDGTFDVHTQPPGAAEWLQTGLRKLKMLDFLTRESEATLAQIALQFVLSDERAAAALPNITGTERLREFAAAADLPELDGATLERIDDLYVNGFYLEDGKPGRDA